MKLTNYQQFARGIMDPQRDLHIQPVIRALGLIEEAVEVYEVIRAAIDLHAPTLRETRVLEETGDALWEFSNLCQEFGFSLDQFAAFAEAATAEDLRALEKLSSWECAERFAYHLVIRARKAAGYLKKVIDQRHPLDRMLLQETFALVLYTLARIGDCCGSSLEEIAQGNVDKLHRRYANGTFTAAESINRADVASEPGEDDAIILLEEPDPERVVGYMLTQTASEKNTFCEGHFEEEGGSSQPHRQVLAPEALTYGLLCCRCDRVLVRMKEPEPLGAVMLHADHARLS